jgi:hypothetical protein
MLSDSQMEAWALSVERRSMELTRTNRTLRAASEQHKKVGMRNGTAYLLSMGQLCLHSMAWQHRLCSSAMLFG